MATVYLAHDLSLDRKVAIKVMSAALLAGDGVERFRREARTAASLSHPNTIPIYAVRQSDRLLFFVMKYVAGRPLDYILRELGPLPIPMVQAILGQVTGAFGYAHRRGVVHRDIKPANVLIDEEGWAVVTDFGIAKVTESEMLTTTGLAVGTPLYMSPEQVLAQPVTGASDQYALGVVAYEMLTGRAPFRDAPLLSLMYAHVHTPPEPLLDLRPDCPARLAAAVMRMLEKDPAQRWPTVEDALVDIGTPGSAYDEEARNQLIELARTGSHEAMVGMPRTPYSPIPLNMGLAASGASGARPTATPAAAVAPIDAADAPLAAPPVGAPASRGTIIAAALVAVVLVGAIAMVTRRPRQPVAAETRPPAAAEAQPPAESAIGSNASAASTAGGASAAASAAPTQPTRRGDSSDVGASVATPEHSTAAASTVVASSVADRPAKNAALGRGAVSSRPTAVASRRAAPVDSSSANGSTPLTAASKIDSATGSTPAPSKASAGAAGASSPISGASAMLGASAAPIVSTAETDRAAVQRAIRVYAAAIEGGRVAEAAALFPGMTAARRAALDSLAAQGAHIATSWKISDVDVRGTNATARIRGTTRSQLAGKVLQEERLDAHLALRQVTRGWVITGVDGTGAP